MRSVVLVAGLVGLGFLAPRPAGGQDKKPPAKVEFPGFVDHIRITGEVEAVNPGEDDAKEAAGLTLKVPTGGRGGQAKFKSYSLSLHDNAQIRWAVEPKKLDAKGKKLPNTAAERAELKAPAGFPGFAATRSDLAKGQTVEVQLLRPKGGKPEAMTELDFKVKFVLIAGDPGARKSPDDKDKPEGKKKK